VQLRILRGSRRGLEERDEEVIKEILEGLYRTKLAKYTVDTRNLGWKMGRGR
tara:strand:+ start:217 stop:372 length:156 start_codon:yes stop_codon:yes gene_type:complete